MGHMVYVPTYTLCEFQKVVGRIFEEMMFWNCWQPKPKSVFRKEQERSDSKNAGYFGQGYPEKKKKKKDTGKDIEMDIDTNIWYLSIYLYWDRGKEISWTFFTNVVGGAHTYAGHAGQLKIWVEVDTVVLSLNSRMQR